METPAAFPFQDDCQAFPKLLMVSLSNHVRLEPASFDKLRMIRQAQDERALMKDETLQSACFPSKGPFPDRPMVC